MTGQKEQASPATNSEDNNLYREISKFYYVIGSAGDVINVISPF